MFDFVRFSLGVELLQFGDELGDGVFAVAAGDDFKAGAVQTKGALRHQQNLLALVFTEADAGGQLRLAVRIDAHRSAFSGWKAPGGGQPGWT